MTVVGKRALVLILAVGATHGACSNAEPPRTAHSAALGDAQKHAASGASRGVPSENCWQRFAELDSDGNGRLTEREFRNLPDPQLSLNFLFAERDLDRDGSLTRYEFCSSGAP